MSRSSILGSVAVMLGMNAKAFEQSIKKTELSFKRMGKNLTSIGKSMTYGITLPLVAAGGSAIKMASDAEETENRFNAVFGSMSDSVKGFAKELSTATGRNFYQLQDGLASFQGFGQGMGLSAEKSAEFAKELQSLAIDFASFNNLSDAEAQERFISAMSGSSEVLDKFGVNLRESNLSLKLQELGLANSTKEATEAQKAIARLSIIKDVMGKQGALGDAVATSGSFANQLRALQSGLSELAVEIGKALLPSIQKAAAFIQKMIDYAKRLDSEVIERFVKFAAVVAIGGPLLLGLGALLSAIAAIGLPALALGAAIAAIAAALLYVRDNLPAFEAAMINTFRSVADSVLTSIQQMLLGLMKFTSVIPGMMQTIAAGISGVEGLKDNLPVAQDAVAFGSFGDAVKNTFYDLIDSIGLFKKEASTIPDSINTSFEANSRQSNFNIGFKVPDVAEAKELTQMQIAQAQALAEVFDSVAESFARTFVDGISDLKNFGEAWKAFGQSVIEVLKEIAVQLVKMAAIKGIAQLLGIDGALTTFDIASGLFKGKGIGNVEKFIPR
jgi:hypothetical protein